MYKEIFKNDVVNILQDGIVVKENLAVVFSTKYQVVVLDDDGELPSDMEIRKFRLQPDLKYSIHDVSNVEKNTE
jgi:MinD superfamily P-loop ATPase